MNIFSTYFISLFVTFFGFSFTSKAEVDPDQLGAWYTYFGNYDAKNSRFGAQGDVQYRNWNLGGDLEQLLIRAGGTYEFRVKSTNFLTTVGAAHVTSGEFGRELKEHREENRLYQELLLPHKLGKKTQIMHRFRSEQRFMPESNFQTRYRYAFNVNYALNAEELQRGAYYLSLSNELFLHCPQKKSQKSSGNAFDRNRAYLGMGYVLNANLRFQLGGMYQRIAEYGKAQLQFSMHHKF
jgi:phage-related protein